MTVFRGHRENLFVLVFLLIAGLSDFTLAVATVGESVFAPLGATFPVDQASLVIDPAVVSGSSLAEIGTEIFKVPSAEDAACNLASVIGVSSGHKTMPAVPAALTLVLTGFLCISLVRDRKTWLAAFVGLVCLGQFGISTLPKLADNLRAALRPGKVSSVASRHIADNAAGIRDRREIEGTRYIGLLKKLSGIPGDASSSTSNIISTTDSVCDLVISAQPNLTNKISAFAAYISNLFGFETLLACPVRSTGHSLAFLPAFCISNLPHGPPKTFP